MLIFGGTKHTVCRTIRESLLFLSTKAGEERASFRSRGIKATAWITDIKMPFRTSTKIYTSNTGRYDLPQYLYADGKRRLAGVAVTWQMFIAISPTVCHRMQFQLEGCRSTVYVCILFVVTPNLVPVILFPQMIVFGDSASDAGRKFNAPASFDFEDIGPFPWTRLFEAPDSDVRDTFK